MPVEPDYYAVLQVSAEAEIEVITAAYKRLARKYHPDLNPDASAAQRMRDLNRAIEVLSDPQKRAEYDKRRRRWRARHVEPTLLPESEPRPADPRWRRRALAAAAILAAVGAGVGLALVAKPLLDTAGGPSQEALDVSTGPAPTVVVVLATPAQPSPTEPSSQGSATFSNGTWLVGEEIAPGMWRAVRSRTCSWKRLSSIEGDDEIVAGSGSQLTVEVKPSDAAFWSDGCGWWTQILTPPSAGPTHPFGAGTWLVGEEIAPGLWQNSDSSEGCTWSRLSSLDGRPSAINANGSTTSTLTVQISETDRAFDSWGCGTWTRVGN